MIRCKGKQNIKGFRKSRRQWYSLAVNGFNTALLTIVILGQSVILAGLPPFKTGREAIAGNNRSWTGNNFWHNISLIFISLILVFVSSFSWVLSVVAHPLG